MSKKILYIGGYILPDKNAAAQRVIGVAKGLRSIGYDVCFLNSLKETKSSKSLVTEYYGFTCYEYKRESTFDYCISADTVIKKIKLIKPDAIIAYNYPALALNSIRSYCRKNKIKCFADVTEWYDSNSKNILYSFIKIMDTEYRMRYVHKKLDGIIAISRFIYDYYRNNVNTILLPPTVDITDQKWRVERIDHNKTTTFVYAGVPSITKEKLDIIINAVENVPRKYEIELKVVGITANQFTSIYNRPVPAGDSVKFLGRVEHKKVIEIVTESDWSIILREPSRVVQAGFPTKLVESISCGTPVIINAFSNVSDYLDENNSLIIPDFDSLETYIIRACTNKPTFSNEIFDYHNYLHELRSLFEEENTSN